MSSNNKACRHCAKVEECFKSNPDIIKCDACEDFEKRNPNGLSAKVIRLQSEIALLDLVLNTLKGEVSSETSGIPIRELLDTYQDSVSNIENLFNVIRHDHGDELTKEIDY